MKGIIRKTWCVLALLAVMVIGAAVTARADDFKITANYETTQVSSISVNGATNANNEYSAAAGSMVKVEVNTQYGYQCSGLKVGTQTMYLKDRGYEPGTNATFNFTMPAADTAISPVIITSGTTTSSDSPANSGTETQTTTGSYKVKIIRGTGVASATGENTYTAGAAVSVIATAQPGYMISGWAYTGIKEPDYQGDQELRFTMPAADVVITVSATLTTTTTTQSKTVASPTGQTTSTVASMASGLSENADPSGAEYGDLQLRMGKASASSITIKWKAQSGAVKYIVFGAQCGSKYEQLGTVSGTSYVHSGLTKGKYYKYFVAAVDSNSNITDFSKSVHIATKGGKVSNFKKIKVSAKKVTLSVGKSKKVKATGVKPSGKKVKKHRRIQFESSDTSVATVTNSGKIKAVGKGTCIVYAYDQAGKMAKIKVKVK